jgi:hypothetical protein
MGEYKNQHYVPKFYLKRFYTRDTSYISFYDKNRKNFCPKTSIRKECSSEYYYGSDLKNENILSDIENDHNYLIESILSDAVLPEKGTLKHKQLLCLVALFYLRHPKIINARKFLYEKLINQSISHNHAVDISLNRIPVIANFMFDLEILLLHNRTNTPFITSDYPLVRFSQYLQAKKEDISELGFNSEGIQVFMALSPSVCLVLYDQRTYDITSEVDRYIDVHSETDIFQLNLLQLLNCRDKVYFNSDISKEYTDKLEQEYQKILQLDSMSNEFVTIDDRLIIPEAEQLINEHMNHLALDLSSFKVRSSI